MSNSYYLLTFNSESGDKYNFLFKEVTKDVEKFLRLNIPWECDEDGLLIGGGYSWEHLDVED